ncbi:MAG: AAA-like domain-containing protein [Defluviitaleaceae bacterium]|nr:AAA-like domain-containing protein [Defluviitaleaceae bacterium]MCL2275245.1 AAA-like domain-containing protein [Defluviitaleaceae bacterium]
MRRFNVTGLCTPEEDYMVDINEKIMQIKKLVDNRSYFTINRARQYGKTTTLNELSKVLVNEYIVISLSFQGIGDESFASSDLFCRSFITQVAQALQFTRATSDYIRQWENDNITTFEQLSRHITKMCDNRKLVLLIDEVDRTSNNKIFLHFIDMLREKFLARKAKRDSTFHSVILAGVYDIKNIKLKMINEGSHALNEIEGKTYNSPWNIATDFTIDLSFSAFEIANMLSEYEKDHSSGMNAMQIADDIYIYTCGYPFLVSRICQIIDERLARDWTPEGVQRAIKVMLVENNTLFEDIIKNLENNKELAAFIYDLLIARQVKPFVIYDPLVGAGVMYGFLKNVTGSIAIANKIFELLMIDYFISKDLRSKKQISGVLQRDVVRDNKFDMALCLRKFAEHYAEIYNQTDSDFLERHGRLLFLSYLKPLINGQGFYHIESQLMDLRRMDVVVNFGQQQYILELKIWNGNAKHENAYNQLCGYLNSKHALEGYLLTFDFRHDKNKTIKAEWVQIGDVRIFDVVV